jgi:hypothetical protein
MLLRETNFKVKQRNQEWDEMISYDSFWTGRRVTHFDGGGGGGGGGSSNQYSLTIHEWNDYSLESDTSILKWNWNKWWYST